MKKKFVPILLGTARHGRQSEKVANYLVDQAQRFGFKTELVDVRDFADLHTVPYWEPQAKDDYWREVMNHADGLIIVAPEYNHSFPGELKIMLDKLYEEYQHKPVAIAGVSAGPFGGTRVIQSLKLVLSELQLIPIFNNLQFINIEKIFDKAGTLIELAYQRRVKKTFTEIDWYASNLK